jgi:hypothetical protein
VQALAAFAVIGRINKCWAFLKADNAFCHEFDDLAVARAAEAKAVSTVDRPAGLR